VRDRKEARHIRIGARPIEGDHLADGAPEFETLLADPYPEMLDIDLSRSEIADIAYIGGLDR
jgi:hypothetical protein